MKCYSFIIPHYNSPELLNRCIDSIPQREDIEIIVIDDNSDVDKKPQNNRSDLCLLFIDAEHSKGAGRARNVGLEHVKGKWIVFADADDFFPSNFIEELDKYKDSDYEVVFHNAKMVDTLSLLPYNGYIDKEMSIVSNYDGTAEREFEIRYRLSAPWWKMIKADFLKHYQIKFEEVPKGNDVLFSILVGYFSRKIIVIDKPLYVYTYNSHGISNKKKNELIYFDMFCRRNKVLGFYQFIGHPDRTSSKVKDWLKIIKNDGPLVFIRTIKECIVKRKYLKQCYHEYTERIEMILNQNRERNETEA